MRINRNVFLNKGAEKSLELIDLEGNALTNVSAAFATLRTLRYLYLPNNRLTSLDADVFSAACPTLRALSVSGNQIASFPTRALAKCTKLSHLNIGYNHLRSLDAGDFKKWCANLDTLILRNNRLTQLGTRIFRFCPKLRELSLSFNAFDQVI